MKNWKRGIKLAAVSTMCALVLTGCTKSCMVSHNVSKEANNFNVERKITVINVRNNQVLYELTGTFSMQNSDKNELTIISEVGENNDRHGTAGGNPADGENMYHTGRGGESDTLQP